MNFDKSDKWREKQSSVLVLTDLSTGNKKFYREESVE